MTPSQRLVARLREDASLAALLAHPIPEDAQVARTYAGPAQRAAGAWTWRLANRADRMLYVGDWTLLWVGSIHPVRDLAKAERLEYSVEYNEVSIYPA